MFGSFHLMASQLKRLDDISFDLGIKMVASLPGVWANQTFIELQFSHLLK